MTTVVISTSRVSLGATTGAEHQAKGPFARFRGMNWRAAGHVLAAPLFVATLAAPVTVAIAPDAFAQSRTIRVPGSEQQRLDAATTRLATNPNDIDAARDGAEAAMRLGEYEVALGFLNRAEVLAPSDPAIRAARGSVMTLTGKPRLALQLFAEAERMGGPAATFAVDRGLAHDLLGDQASAQYFYALASRDAPDDEVTRRHAFSLAVAGETAAAEAMLRPLVRAEDPAALRIRAFMLAVAGRGGEAVAMLYAVLPRQLAENIAPYMRSVRSLTPAQQVAAAHLGLFPKMAAADPSVGLQPAGEAFGRPGAGDPR